MHRHRTLASTKRQRKGDRPSPLLTGGAGPGRFCARLRLMLVKGAATLQIVQCPPCSLLQARTLTLQAPFLCATPPPPKAQHNPGMCPGGFVQACSPSPSRSTAHPWPLPRRPLSRVQPPPAKHSTPMASRGQSRASPVNARLTPDRLYKEVRTPDGLHSKAVHTPISSHSKEARMPSSLHSKEVCMPNSLHSKAVRRLWPGYAFLPVLLQVGRQLQPPQKLKECPCLCASFRVWVRLDAVLALGCVCMCVHVCVCV